MKLKFNFNKRNKYKNICSIEGCNNSACGKYCNKHYHQIKRYGDIKTRTRFDKNEIIINDNVAKILLYDNNCNVIDYTIIDVEDINKISKYKISKCGNYAYANRCKDDKEVTLLCKYVKNKHTGNCPNCIFNKYLCYGLLCNIVVLKVIKDEELRNNK